MEIDKIEGGGNSVVITVLVVFVTLKLFGVIDASWWWTLGIVFGLPLLGFALIFVCLVLFWCSYKLWRLLNKFKDKEDYK